ncbi:ABC transporter permease [Hamadaea sp. NPDC051192]|uniref:ABC transporter permease n=1 Tax=Hamadaea sp. NPDC051192 TaxID=3154940 RepID=UPI00342281E2
MTASPSPGRRTGSARRPGWLFLARRLGVYALTAWAAATLNFVIPRFMPGDPADVLIRQVQQQTGQLPPQSVIDSYRAFFGDPRKDLLGQYLDYLGNVLHGDFGLSVHFYPVPVADLIGQALPWTLLLAGTTALLGFTVGVLLGVAAGAKPGSRRDSIALPVSAFLGALPYFWIALLALYLFAYRLNWFPLQGSYDNSLEPGVNLEFAASVLHYGFLPVATMVFVGFAGWLIGMRNMMVTTVTEDYVLLARAKGLPSRQVLLRYAARNAMLPSVTGLAQALGGVVGGVIVTEVVFGYPGMGGLLVTSVTAHDFPVMQAVFLLLTITTLAANFVADSVYVLLDPRTREAR